MGSCWYFAELPLGIKGAGGPVLSSLQTFPATNGTNSHKYQFLRKNLKTFPGNSHHLRLSKINNHEIRIPKKIQLEADNLLTLIDTWAEMQLQVTDTTAKIVGYGFAPDIAEAFTTLVFDWEATIILSVTDLKLPQGSFDLTQKSKTLYAHQEQQSFAIADRAVVVELVSVPE